ncbi:phosphodiester glycosidase family protein [Emticicia sp. BO119]|uniref:phosphodiester glycosidase family protein n=1 Tax=Emticicia sp. BO119 TaxID=2757768 RepID=UPI0015F0C045|nr:phosphodiester glycosidase family protein [Emticicia sp. BO119]MBA4849183.1 phosphodiester glycosidase family protein [Emticicia sp. BO119]
MYNKILYLLLFSQICFAQQTYTKDTQTITTTQWKTQDIGYRILWKNHHFNQKNLFDGNQMINILETPLKNKKIRFGLVAADEKKADNTAKRLLLPTSKMATASQSIAAVNAGFFDTKNGGAVDFLKIDGKIMDSTRVINVPRLPVHAISAVTIHKNKVRITRGEHKSGWEKALKEDNVLLTGPLLLLNGQSETLEKNAFNDNRHPRTCACITNDKKLLLITVDGRSSESYGMSLHELTTLAKALNCKDAINFDGGGSTTMYIAGQPDNGVVNYPTDNKIFDHAGERSVSNIFVFLKK